MLPLRRENEPSSFQIRSTRPPAISFVYILAASTKKNDIMTRSNKELVDDYSKRIVNARKERQWSQQQLAKRMAETVNIVKAAESGKRPTDSVITKFERALASN